MICGNNIQSSHHVLDNYVTSIFFWALIPPKVFAVKYFYSNLLFQQGSWSPDIEEGQPSAVTHFLVRWIPAFIPGWVDLLKTQPSRSFVGQLILTLALIVPMNYYQLMTNMHDWRSMHFPTWKTARGFSRNAIKLSTWVSIPLEDCRLR